MNYATCKLSRAVLGVELIHANLDDPLGEDPEIGSDGVVHRCMSEEIEFAYEQLVVFRMASDGTLALLERLPTSVFPDDGASTRYRPLARLIAQTAAPLPYLQLPRWVEPIADISSGGDAFVLGEGWGAKEMSDGRPSRRITPGAELYLNPREDTRVFVELDLEPAGAPVTLSVFDGAGGVLVRERVRGRRRLTVPVPATARRPAKIRMSFGPDPNRESASPLPVVRVYSIRR